MARRRGRDDGYYPHYEPSVPRAAKGGIKARSQRGEFANRWWGRRWMQVLEGFNLGARLGRGRSYARRGQVLSLEVDAGEVRAKVQGSRATPYKVRIGLRVLPGAKWEEVAAAIAGEAIHAAKLLSGEMPPDLEKAFAVAGVSLFPARLGDLETSCSCPDWSNPCKHIAAVYYLLGEEFDRDPFLLFKLRGLEREAFLALLGGLRSEDEGAGEAEEDWRGEEAGGRGGQGVPAAPSLFWSGAGEGTAEEVAVPEAVRPPLKAVLPRSLGGFPFCQDERPFLDVMADAYAAAAESAETAGAETEAEAEAARAPEAGERAATEAGEGAETAQDLGAVPGTGSPERAGKGETRGETRSAVDAGGGSGGTGSGGTGSGGTGSGATGSGATGGKSRDRAALAADLAAGLPWPELERKYDGRLLRPHAVSRRGRREPLT